jgi:4-carboxymuconolactone decarboxylase
VTEIDEGATRDNDPQAWRRRGEQTFLEVMTRPYDRGSSPYNEAGLLDFVFADVWNRPGLSRRDRRWVTLACVGAADTVGPIEAHVYAAMNSGDMSLEEMQEFVLHFAVYCGWPKGSFLDQVVWSQHVRICEARGEPPPAPRQLEVWRAGEDPEQRLQNGAESFATINCVPAPGRTSPYTSAGILNFVFGEVWQRDGLSRRDRRFITLACVGVDDAVAPIRSHVYSALKTGDVTYDEMREVVLHFAAYAGWPKGSFMDQVVAESWATITAEEQASRKTTS